MFVPALTIIVLSSVLSGSKSCHLRVRSSSLPLGNTASSYFCSYCKTVSRCLVSSRHEWGELIFSCVVQYMELITIHCHVSSLPNLGFLPLLIIWKLSLHLNITSALTILVSKFPLLVVTSATYSSKPHGTGHDVPRLTLSLLLTLFLVSLFSLLSLDKCTMHKPKSPPFMGRNPFVNSRKHSEQGERDARGISVMIVDLTVRESANQRRPSAIKVE